MIRTKKKIMNQTEFSGLLNEDCSVYFPKGMSMRARRYWLGERRMVLAFMFWALGGRMLHWVVDCRVNGGVL